MGARYPTRVEHADGRIIATAVGSYVIFPRRSQGAIASGASDPTQVRYSG